MFLWDRLQTHVSSNSITVVGKFIHNLISSWLISSTYLVRFWNLEIFEYLDIWITVNTGRKKWLLGEICIVLTMTQFIQKINIMTINIIKMPTSSNFKNVLACLAYQAGLELGTAQPKIFPSLLGLSEYENQHTVPVVSRNLQNK